MSEYEDTLYLHEGRHPQRVACILGKHQEGSAERNKTSMQRQAVHDGRHAEFTHTVIDIVAVRRVGTHRPVTGPFRQIRTAEIGGTAKQFRKQRGVTLDGLQGCLARCQRFTLLVRSRDECSGLAVPVGRQVSRHAALVLGGQLRMGRSVGRELLVPGILGGRATLFCIPAGIDIAGYNEGFVIPTQFLARQTDLFIPQRCTMAAVRTGLVG